MDRTWVKFWCKDYGGDCEVQVTLKDGGTTVLKCGPLQIPIDTDDDHIADLYERKKLKEWKDLYAMSTFDTNNLAFFGNGSDMELHDPGGGLTDHSTTGDSLTFFQEYRGFILDGGRFHSGGHKRLSPAKKEMLLEVDIMEDITYMSDSAIESVLSDTASLFDSDSGIDLYWALDEKTYFVAAGPYPYVVATGPTWEPRGDLFGEGYDVTFDDYAETNRSDVLKYEFVHLMICSDHHEKGAFFRDGTTGYNTPLISRAAVGVSPIK